VVRYVGVGNICGALVSGTEVKRMVSNNGIVGALSPRIREFVYPCTPATIIVMHSDGISAKWEPQSYPGLSMAHPSVLTGVLLRDFRRARDDAGIVALRVA
jgi:hypothetical protein